MTCAVCGEYYYSSSVHIHSISPLFDNPMDGLQFRLREAMEAKEREMFMVSVKAGADIVMVENGDGVYWQAPGSVLVGTHRHGIAEARIVVYLDSGATDGMPVTWCKYQNQLTETIPHEFLLKAADMLGIEKHVCPEPVVREVGLALTFGEVAALRADMHINQHLLNDDLRRAMVANVPDEVAAAQAHLADHMSLMEKLGIEPAPWADNHHALMRAGRLEVETLVDEPTLWR